MINILIDTNIILQEGFESRQMQILRRLVQGEKVQVYIPEIVKREFLTKKSSDISSDIHSICKKLVSFKSVYMRIFYDFFIAQIQLLLMSTEQQKSFLGENGPPEKLVGAQGTFLR